jgi:hypothetical protein
LQDTGHPDLSEHDRNLPGPSSLHLNNDLHESFESILLRALKSNVLPPTWASDVDKTANASLLVRKASRQALGLTDIIRDDPEGALAPVLKRDKVEMLKLSKKIANKKSVLRNLESYKEKGDIPPTLRIPLPTSMNNGKDCENARVVSYIELLEMLKATENKALQATIDTRRFDLQ